MYSFTWSERIQIGKKLHENNILLTMFKGCASKQQRRLLIIIHRDAINAIIGCCHWGAINAIIACCHWGAILAQ